VSTTGRVEIFAVQDTPHRKSYTLRRRLCLLEGTVLDEEEIGLQTEPQRGLLVESVDFTELLAKHGRDKVFLRVQLLDPSGATCAEAFSFFTAPRSLSLSAAPISSEWQEINETESLVSLRSEVCHFSVCLELDGYGAKWSDNFFHLPPGESKTVRVRFSRELAGESRPPLRIYSLIESYSG